MPPIITLTTDFGTSEPFVGIMKGVILSVAPEAVLIDLSHDIPAQDVVAGALALEAAVPWFPAGTIHVAVVDPGVGTERRAVAVRLPRCVLVGPDNGIFGLVTARDPAVEAVALTNPAHQLHPASATFHGRDIFAPAAAHLAAGVPLSALGGPITHLAPLALPDPVVTAKGLQLRVLSVDRFGNLVTNLRRDHWERIACPGEARVRVGTTLVGTIRRTYADAAPGAPVAYFGSSDRLEVGVRNGSASRHLGVGPGDLVELTFAA